jgi:organic radical activating enzyme
MAAYPLAILMDPTSACNLKCTGCWAAEYGHKLNLTLEELDSVIKQGEELGCYLYIFSGGEPLVRKSDIIKLCEMHPNAVFSHLQTVPLSMRNLPMICCELKLCSRNKRRGFEEATDDRRGKGTFAAVQNVMALLNPKSC